MRPAVAALLARAAALLLAGLRLLARRPRLVPARVHPAPSACRSSSTTPPVFDVDRQVTERVRSELIGRGKYKVEPDATGVDALLTGRRSPRSRSTPAAFNEQQQATRYALTLAAKVEFKDVKSEQGALDQPGDAVHARSSSSTTDQRARLRRRSSARTSTRSSASHREFARALVSAILEASRCRRASGGRAQADRAGAARSPLSDRRRRRGGDVAAGGRDHRARRRRAPRVQRRAHLRRRARG